MKPNDKKTFFSKIYDIKIIYLTLRPKWIKQNIPKALGVWKAGDTNSIWVALSKAKNKTAKAEVKQGNPVSCNK